MQHLQNMRILSGLAKRHNALTQQFSRITKQSPADEFRQTRSLIDTLMRKMSRMSNEQQQAEGYTHYIWHTVGDNRTRSSHAANDGKVFAWNNPPETGHPGDDYNCRCWAEPYRVPSEENLPFWRQVIIDAIENHLRTRSKWDSIDMALYFYIASRGITLNEIGHLEDVRRYYEEHYRDRFYTQIIDNSEDKLDGSFSDTFETSYSFKDLFFAYGDATMTGMFEGQIITDTSGKRNVSGYIQYRFYDLFTDPASLRSNAVEIINKILIKHFNQSLSEYGFDRIGEIDEFDLPEIIQSFSEVAGNAYGISGEWTEQIAL
ncbi:MAG: minor capsid protein [Rickettsiales bacterium]|nr:minor capsid protein [Rickettsiales bacterium]